MPTSNCKRTLKSSEGSEDTIGIMRKDDLDPASGEMAKVSELIALKRYERPPEGYFEDFLEEFHRRQRLDQSRTAVSGGVFQRFSNWWSEVNASRWVYGAGAAYAAVMVTLMMVKTDSPSTELPGKVLPTEGVRVIESPQLDGIDAESELNSGVIDLGEKRDEATRRLRSREF